MRKQIYKNTDGIITLLIYRKSKKYRVTFNEIDLYKVRHHRWYLKQSGKKLYPVTTINGEHVPLSKFILNTTEKVNYADGNPLNNTRQNLQGTVSQRQSYRSVKTKKQILIDKIILKLNERNEQELSVLLDGLSEMTLITKSDSQDCSETAKGPTLTYAEKCRRVVDDKVIDTSLFTALVAHFEKLANEKGCGPFFEDVYDYCIKNELFPEYGAEIDYYKKIFHLLLAERTKRNNSSLTNLSQHEGKTF